MHPLPAYLYKYVSDFVDGTTTQQAPPNWKRYTATYIYAVLFIDALIAQRAYTFSVRFHQGYWYTPPRVTILFVESMSSEAV